MNDLDLQQDCRQVKNKRTSQELRCCCTVLCSQRSFCFTGGSGRGTSNTRFVCCSGRGQVSRTEQLPREKQSFEAASNGRLQQQATQLRTNPKDGEIVTKATGTREKSIRTRVERCFELRSTVRRKSTSLENSRGESRGDAPPTRTSALSLKRIQLLQGFFPVSAFLLGDQGNGPRKNEYAHQL